MHASFRALAAVVVAAVTLPSGELVAQLPDGWSLGVSGQGGYYFSPRRLGANNTGALDRPNLQVTADMDNTAMLAAKIFATSADGHTTWFLEYATTLDGSVTGRLGICGDPDDPLFGGELCAPFTVDASVVDVRAGLELLRGDPRLPVRPFLQVAAGLRSYDFAELGCGGTGELGEICRLAGEIWTDPGISPAVTVGAGLRSGFGPVNLFVRGTALASRFGGGTGNTTSGLQTDVTLSAGLAVAFR